MFDLAKLFTKKPKDLIPEANVIDLDAYRSKKEEAMAHKKIQEEIDRDLLEQHLIELQLISLREKEYNESIEAYLFRLRALTTQMEVQFRDSQYAELIQDFVYSLSNLEKEIERLDKK